MTRKDRELQSALEAVSNAKALSPESATEVLRVALAHRHWLVVSQAAEAVGELCLDGLKDLLTEVWSRFIDKASKTDPGCRAKEAALTALDRLELFDPAPFLAAIRYRQLEPALGGAVDTAGGVRQRALFGLLRLCHPDAPLYAGELLADPDAPVRAGAARALGYYGDRTAAALLVCKQATPIPW